MSSGAAPGGAFCHFWSSPPVRLSVGNHVSDLDGSHEGELVDIDGSTGYVMQKNGVEIEFPLNRLKPYEPPKITEKRTLSGPLRDRALSPEHKALLASVPPEVMAAIARSYASGNEGSASRSAFDALPASKQLEVIRIHLPSLPRRLIAQHVKLALAFRDLGKPGR